MHHLLHFFLRLGPLGLFVLGAADSSFLFLPFGNDLLLTILVVRHQGPPWELVPMAATGSVVGVFLLDLVCRKGGEAGLEKMMSKKRLNYLKKKMSKRAGYAIVLACIAPPPFPFTAVLAAASAFQYPRRKLFPIEFLTRLVRFSIIAALASVFGREILSIMRSRTFTWAVIGFVILCAIGSVFSVVGWLRRSGSSKKP